MKQVHITNNVDYSKNLDKFLKENENIEIVAVINHKPYHTTLIYKSGDVNSP